MTSRSRVRTTGTTGMWRLLLVLALVFAAGAQQVVAQAHWHTTTVASQGQSGSPDGAGKTDNCLWCQIAAHASAAAPPAVLPSVVVPETHAVRIARGFESTVFPRPAHAWQSRGPPIA
jgi:hypothetical protein